MARIKVSDLAKNLKVSKENSKRVIGGISQNLLRSYAVMNTKEIDSNPVTRYMGSSLVTLPGMDW